jgi:alcohol dehydrogenase, propanol-preferring
VSLGAEARRSVAAAIDDPVEAIQALGGADVAIAVAVSPVAFEQAYRSLKRGGTLVFVALPADNYMQLPIFETVLHGITVVGSIVGTRVDLAETFQLHAEGRTQVVRETRHLEQVNEAFEQIEKAEVDARLVFDFR